MPLVAGTLNAILGALVLRNNPHTATHRLFALLSLSLVFWHLNIFVLYFVADQPTALYWSSFFRVGTILAPAIAAHFVAVFAESVSPRLVLLLIFGYSLSLFLVVTNLSGHLVTGLRSYSWGYYPIGTRLYQLFPLAVAFNLTLMISILVRVARSDISSRKRQQARLWLLGIVIAVPFGMTNLIGAFGIPFYPLGNLANVIYAAVIAYGIIRYRLMDVDIVITKSSAYALVILFVLMPAFIISVYLQQRLFGHANVDFSVAILFLFLLVAIFFPLARDRIESRLEQSLFRNKHDYRLAMKEFSKSILRILDNSRLIQELALTLSGAMQLEGVVVALWDDGRQAYTARHVIGFGPSAITPFFRPSLIDWASWRFGPILREEFIAKTRQAGPDVLSPLLHNSRWEVLVPLALGGEVIGFIALGAKKNRDPFFNEDLDVLETLAAEAAVALQNSRLYEQLKRSQDVIRRADRLSALGTLAAGIAHEIRNPLVSIQTFFQLAPQRLDDQEFLTEFLRLTSGEVKRITDLITELLSFAKSPTPTIEEVDLNEILDGVRRLIEPEVKKRQITIEESMDRSLPSVRADRDQLKQVFLNILFNALQALDSKGQIWVGSRTVTLPQGTFCQVQITDSGRGIPQELLDHIFDPFFTTKEKGTGLGLAISNQVIAEHGGFISVESGLERGTSFSVHLPIVSAPHAGKAPAETQQSANE